MSTTTPAPSGGSPDPEIVSARLFAAPREAVFRAFADPGLLARWWGPEGFTSTFHEFDPRPGGTRLTWRVRFDSAEEAARVRDPFLAANEQNLDRLEALLGADR